MSGPLSGFRVFDATHYAVGPWACALLGQMGAEVIKVEPPGGDFLSRQPPPYKNGITAVYISMNLNKRCVTMDLRDEELQDVVTELVRSSDILIENHRPGFMERRGLGYEQAAAINPGIVYCSASGYGSRGPYHLMGSVDPYGQAISGFAAVSGPVGGPPEGLKQGSHIDLTTVAVHRRRGAGRPLPARVDRPRPVRRHLADVRLDRAQRLAGERVLRQRCEPAAAGLRRRERRALARLPRQRRPLRERERHGRADLAAALRRPRAGRSGAGPRAAEQRRPRRAPRRGGGADRGGAGGRGLRALADAARGRAGAVRPLPQLQPDPHQRAGARAAHARTSRQSLGPRHRRWPALALQPHPRRDRHHAAARRGHGVGGRPVPRGRLEAQRRLAGHAGAR